MASEILVKINVESGQADVSLKKAKVSVDKLAAAEKRLVEVQKKEAVELAAVNLQIKERIQVNNQLAAEQLKNVKKSSGQFRTQVGLNNAILTEAGRAASDARFGFNGVANNVGQLASLFGNLIQTSDNVGTSLKNLLKSLMGTGGILIAIQLLIAYGDQIYNFFTGMSESAVKAEKAMKKLEGTVQSQRRELLGYIDVLNDSTISEEARINALNELNIVSKETVQDYEDGKISLDKLTESVELYIKQQRLRGQLEAILSSNKEVFNEREKIRGIEAKISAAKTLEEQREIMYENLSFLETIEASAIRTARVINNEEGSFLDLFLEIKKGDIDDYDAAVASIIEIEKKLTANREDPSGGGANRDPKVFEQKLLQLEQIEQRYREKSINNDLKTNEERINIFEENELAKLDIRIKNFIERRALTLKNYKEDINNLKISNEEKQKLIEDAEKKHTEEVAKANNDRGEVKEQIEAVGDLKLKRLVDKEAQIRRASGLREVEALKFSLGNNEAYYEAKSALLRKNIEAEEDIVNSFAEGTAERANAEAQLFKTRDALRQNELQQEKDAIGEKTRVQQEYIGFAQGISSILGNIDKKNEGLRKAALVIEKGAAIADIIIKTQAANAITVAEDTASLGATLPITTPLRARNNISAGISIASILATTISSFNKPSGGAGGGGGGASVTAPAFNVVGASATNQLAGAVAGQVNAPLRAYVVGSDISDQQELDRSIISTAGIG